MPLTSSRMEGEVLIEASAAWNRSARRVLRFDQVWQSSGVRRSSFFSDAYLVAAAFTIGLMIASSACNQSDVKFHLVPSQVCTRAHAAPMWSAQEVEILSLIH